MFFSYWCCVRHFFITVICLEHSFHLGLQNTSLCRLHFQRCGYLPAAFYVFFLSFPCHGFIHGLFCLELPSCCKNVGEILLSVWKWCPSSHGPNATVLLQARIFFLSMVLFISRWLQLMPWLLPTWDKKKSFPTKQASITYKKEDWTASICHWFLPSTLKTAALQRTVHMGSQNHLKNVDTPVSLTYILLHPFISEPLVYSHVAFASVMVIISPSFILKH